MCVCVCVCVRVRACVRACVLFIIKELLCFACQYLSTQQLYGHHSDRHNCVVLALWLNIDGDQEQSQQMITELASRLIPELTDSDV